MPIRRKASPPSPARRRYGRRRHPNVAPAEPPTTSSIAPWPMPERASPRAVGALAYAAQPRFVPSRAAPPMGSGSPRIAPVVAGNPDTTTVAVKRSEDQSPAVPIARGGAQCRAGRRSFQRSLGARHDAQPERAGLHANDAFRPARFPHSGSLPAKPGSAVIMKFTADPSGGITTKVQRQRGSLHADGFFPRTASLR